MEKTRLAIFLHSSIADMSYTQFGVIKGKEVEVYSMLQYLVDLELSKCCQASHFPPKLRHVYYDKQPWKR
jgi:succinylglutamate desuccinylase